tara:strand:+ start:3504 stop:4217 length:714 start_codon:yes stop_codon:yes gene_type:complete
MKITRRQLKRLIKEQMRGLLSETRYVVQSGDTFTGLSDRFTTEQKRDITRQMIIDATKEAGVSLPSGFHPGSKLRAGMTLIIPDHPTDAAQSPSVMKEPKDKRPLKTFSTRHGANVGRIYWNKDITVSEAFKPAYQDMIVRFNMKVTKSWTLDVMDKEGYETLYKNVPKTTSDDMYKQIRLDREEEYVMGSEETFMDIVNPPVKTDSTTVFYVPRVVVDDLKKFLTPAGLQAVKKSR